MVGGSRGGDPRLATDRTKILLRSHSSIPGHKDFRLPRTRGIVKGNAVAFRFHEVKRATRARLEKDWRIAAFDKDKMRWFSYELSSDAGLQDAVDCLALAYEAAKSGKRARSPQK